MSWWPRSSLCSNWSHTHPNHLVVSLPSINTPAALALVVLAVVQPTMTIQEGEEPEANRLAKRTRRVVAAVH